MPDNSENSAGVSSGKARRRRVPVGTRRSRNTVRRTLAGFAAGAEYLDRLLALALVGEIAEFGVVFRELQLNHASWPITMFSNNNLGYASVI